MLRFSRPVTPAIQDYINAQCALLSEISKRAFQSAQKINELNIQVSTSVMEDTLKNVQQVFVAQDPYEAASILASQAQPVAEKLRDYQQKLTNIAANTQVELVKTAESHAPNASRTAAAVADEVARTAQEQTNQAVARQKAAIDKAATAASTVSSVVKSQATQAQSP
jgi:phasin family protein